MPWKSKFPDGLTNRLLKYVWYLLENSQFMDTYHIVLINFIYLTDSSKWILVHYIEEYYSIKFTSDNLEVTFIVIATISCQVKEYWRNSTIFNICWLIYHLSDICRITKKLKWRTKFCILNSFFSGFIFKWNYDLRRHGEKAY